MPLPSDSIRLLASLCACLLTWTAHAHLPSTSDVRIAVTPGRISLMTRLDAHDLERFDLDADGILTRAEFQAQTPVIQDWVDAHIDVVGANASASDLLHSDLPVPGFADLAVDDPVRAVRIVRTYSTTSNTAHALLRIRLFDDDEPGHTRRFHVLSSSGVVTGLLSPDNNVIDLSPRTAPDPAGAHSTQE